MPSIWITALKEYNDKKGGMWCVPKKDSNEYNEIKKIMDRLKLSKASASAEPKPKPKMEPKPEPKMEPKPKPKMEPKPEPKMEPKLPKASASAEPEFKIDLNKHIRRDPVMKQAYEDTKIDRELDTGEILEFADRDKKISPDEVIKLRRDYRTEPIKTIKEMFYNKYSLQNMLNVLEFNKSDIQMLNAFLTPKDVSKKLIDISGIENDKRKEIEILEPTAGIGNLIRPLLNLKNKNNFIIFSYEVNYDLFNLGYVIYKNIRNVIYERKNTYINPPTNRKYDYIFTNPPFNIKDYDSDGRLYDIDFLNKYYSLLKDGGLLCAIISKSNVRDKRGSYKKFYNNYEKLFKEGVFVATTEIKGFNKDNTITKDMATNISMEIVILKKVPNVSTLF